jgi:hypothetical protein
MEQQTEEFKIVEDGNFARWARASLLVIGLLIMVLSYKFVPPAPFGGFLLLLGLGLAAVGGFASRANLLHIKPFGNGYREARKSYEVTDDDQNKSQ